MNKKINKIVKVLKSYAYEDGSLDIHVDLEQGKLKSLAEDILKALDEQEG